MRRILASITTHGHFGGSNWRSKLLELKQLDLSECALFVTGLSPAEREHCFAELLKLRQEKHFTIPFVHAVSSMSEAEFQFLFEEFQTEAFNLHPQREYPLEHKLSREIRQRIFIENTCASKPLCAKDVEGFGGLCIDVSHLEEMRLLAPQAFQQFLPLIHDHKVGANHISAVRLVPERHKTLQTSVHDAQSASDFQYLANYAPEVFSKFCAIEVENPLQEQLQFIKTVSKLIETQTAANLVRAA